jgi:hypothetical protein
VVVRYGRPAWTRVEPVGEIWAAFSPVSGETLLLNDESAAVLEILESGSADLGEIIQTLIDDTGVDRPVIEAAVMECWPQLVRDGLVRQVDGLPDAGR